MSVVAKWSSQASTGNHTLQKAGPIEPATVPQTAVEVYAEPPEEFNFITLQTNLQNCLSIIDNEVMKNYVPELQDQKVLPLEEAVAELVGDIQFFRISELVYQEDEFSVYKLATIFNALSNKPCTLVLMIRSDGVTNDFYLGVRSRSPEYSVGTMRQLLEQSLLGLFPGSATSEYLKEHMQADLEQLEQKTGAVSCVTCIADYKQRADIFENKSYIQGLEKFIYSMQGKAFTAICIANNLGHQELVETRKEYERIYTLLSPFANMQYNYGMNQSSSKSVGTTEGRAEADNTGITAGVTANESVSVAKTSGSSIAETTTDTEGENSSASIGKTSTTSSSDGTNNSETTTKSVGTYAGVHAGRVNAGVTASVSRAKTCGVSHTDSISTALSHTLTSGRNSSKSVGYTSGTNESATETKSKGTGTQYSENFGHSVSVNVAQSKTLTDTFGNSQAVILNVQNKSLLNVLERLEKQLDRLDECESIGMWDFAAYFLGESAAEAESAASMYRSLISGDQSGLEIAAVNTWTDENRVREITKYVTRFLHPVFRCDFSDGLMGYETYVDATALASTNELAIQLGLPRKSVKGLPVVEHATFAQEVLSGSRDKTEGKTIRLGVVNHFGKDTGTEVSLDPESLSMHTFITGSTGVGKSNTVYTMLSRLCLNRGGKDGVTFLAIEPAKGEYKEALGGYPGVRVYGTNPSKAPLLRLNPFSFPEDTHVLEHIDRLVEIFNASWPMYAAMPAVLKTAVECAYSKCGWSLSSSKCSGVRTFPTFQDVMQALPDVVDNKGFSGDTQGDYKGALLTRLESLTNGINGQVLCAYDELSGEELFDYNVIVDLSRVGSSETKALLMGVLILKLQEHRMAQRAAGTNQPNSGLQHITVLEEAHNLLRRTSTEQSQESSNLQGKSVEMLTNAIAEMRTYGEGFIIADQAPGLLDMAVIRNTNTKIILRLPDEGDRMLVGKAAGLNDDQVVELSRLDTGVAAIYQNHWLEPVLCRVDRFDQVRGFSYRPSEAQADPLAEQICQALLQQSRDGTWAEREDVDRIKAWIDRQPVGSAVKKLLRRALLEGGPISQPEQGYVFYCLSHGKHLIETIRRASLDPAAAGELAARTLKEQFLVSDATARDIRAAVLRYAADHVRTDLPQYRELLEIGGVR